MVPHSQVPPPLSVSFCLYPPVNKYCQSAGSDEGCHGKCGVDSYMGAMEIRGQYVCIWHKKLRTSYSQPPQITTIKIIYPLKDLIAPQIQI